MQEREVLGRHDKFGFQHDEVLWTCKIPEERKIQWNLGKSLKLEYNFKSRQHVWVILCRKEKENKKKRGSKKDVVLNNIHILEQSEAEPQKGKAKEHGKSKKLCGD